MGWRASGLIGRVLPEPRREGGLRQGAVVGARRGQARPDAHGARALARHDARIGLEAVEIPGRHQIQALAREADDFGFKSRTVAGQHIAVVTHGGLAADCLEGEANHPREITLDGRRRNAPDSPRMQRQMLAP